MVAPQLATSEWLTGRSERSHLQIPLLRVWILPPKSNLTVQCRQVVCPHTFCRKECSRGDGSFHSTICLETEIQSDGGLRTKAIAWWMLIAIVVSGIRDGWIARCSLACQLSKRGVCVCVCVFCTKMKNVKVWVWRYRDCVLVGPDPTLLGARSMEVVVWRCHQSLIKIFMVELRFF